MKNIISNILLIGVCLALLWHFSNIVRYGEHLIQEPNTGVLVAEILLIASMAIYAVVRTIAEVRR